MSTVASENLLLQDIQYQVTETPSGTWRRYLYPSGKMFAEFKSHRTWGELPLVHIVFGRCPETGRFVKAHGVLAVGRIARGYVAIGLLARGFLAVGLLTLGFIAVGLVGVGLLLGMGQFAIGLFSAGQFAAAAILAVGQFAAGHAAIGQMAVGTYVLAQLGWGDHVWDTRAIDPVAHQYFLSLIGK
jgi:hypothetical protein